MNIELGSPNNLCEVFVHDFGDQYHRFNDEPTSELEKKAKKIRRRYKDFASYSEAVNIYNEYMLTLAKKYGGIKMLKFHLKHKSVDDFIPSFPRMKNTSMNKFIMKNKIVLSGVKSASPNDNIENILQCIQPPEDLPDNFPVEKIKDKEVKEILKEDLSTLSPSKMQKIDSIDILEEYFKNKNLVKQEKNTEKIKIPTLSEVLSGEYKSSIKDTKEDDEILYYRGQYLSRGTVDDLMVFDKLSELGWDGIKLMKRSGVSKNITRIMKDKKKKNKKKKGKGTADEFLIQIMGDNNYDDFNDFQKEMLNFTSKNIFK